MPGTAAAALLQTMFCSASAQSMGDEHASLLLPQQGGLQADPAASPHAPEVCRHKATLALMPAGASEAAAQKAALGMGGLGRT